MSCGHDVTVEIGSVVERLLTAVLRPGRSPGQDVLDMVLCPDRNRTPYVVLIGIFRMS